MAEDGELESQTPFGAHTAFQAGAIPDRFIFQNFVGREGIEPSIRRLYAGCSSIELTARQSPQRESNPGLLRTKEVHYHCAMRAFGADGGIRTRTVLVLNEPPPASWATSALGAGDRI